MAGWIETALMVSLFVLLFIGLISYMNVKYNNNIDGSLGLSSLAGDVKNNMTAYQTTLQQSVANGQASSNGFGIDLSTSWNIISSGINIIWNFLTGGWIEQLVGLAQLPLIIGSFLRIIFVISAGLIILRLVLKVSP